MNSEKIIKRRIKSAKNISQITRAMQMVAASKMKKAQDKAVSGRPYAQKITDMLKRFSQNIDTEKHPLLKINQDGKIAVILVSTNKGLCSGLNTNLFRSLSNWFNRQIDQIIWITLGKKGEQFVVRSGGSLMADFSSEQPFTRNIGAIAKLITQGYIKGNFREVYLIYNDFISALKYEPLKKQLLPLQQPGIISTIHNQTEKIDFLVEPSVESILEELLLNYIENQVRDALLQAEASEQSARMMAMKNATDNAMELIDILTLEYNKARQAKITFEIADMVTARLALN